MINTRFRWNNDGDYVVVTKFIDNNGDVSWMCREYWSDKTGYFTTSEINEALAWMRRQGITL